MAAQLISDAVWEELKPKLDGVTTVSADVQKLTTHVEKLTTQLEEHTKKFEEHTKLMDKKFEKQKRLTNASFYLLVALPSIAAFVDIGMNWMMMMNMGESSSSGWDMNGEAPPNSRVFCQYVNMTKGDGTQMWDAVLSAWNYTQHFYNATK